MYTTFAEVYDELMTGVDYRAWASFYAEMMRRWGIPDGSRICECACGTGGLTLPLQAMGYQVTGADISQEMLFIAAQKARAAGSRAIFVRQDMRTLQLHRSADAILATCDGVNYLTQERDLDAFFASAFSALRPGGGLFFDVSTPYKLEHTLGNRTICEDTPRITYMWDNRWHPKNRTVDLNLCIFVRESDGRYRRMDESQRQRGWTREELTSALRRAGFETPAFYGNSRLVSPRETEERWHVAAVRRKEENDEIPV